MNQCPLSLAWKSCPHKVFVDAEIPITFGAFERYVQQLQTHFSKNPKGTAIAITTLHPLFLLAMLVAAMRSEWILFPINHRLPTSEIVTRLQEIGSTIYLQDPIERNPQSPLKDCIFQINVKAPLTYLLTSGSSSRPKICVHSILNHLSSAKCSIQVCQFTAADNWLLSLPLYHVGGLAIFFRALIAQGSLFFCNESLEKSLKSNNLSHLSCVGTQLEQLMKAPSFLKPLKSILLGGGPPNPFLLKKCNEHSLNLQITYGLTEMSSQVATSPIKGTHLIALPHTSMHTDPQGHLLVKGPSLFLGYLENRRIISACDKAGWFNTRDLAELNHDILKLKGRGDHLFISGGENIHPEEIEAYLLKYPMITEAIVVPQEDPKFGQVPHALIKYNGQLNLQQLTEFLEKHLPRYKVPKYFSCLEYSSLKPSRKELACKLPKLERLI